MTRPFFSRLAAALVLITSATTTAVAQTTDCTGGLTSMINVTCPPTPPAATPKVTLTSLYLDSSGFPLKFELNSPATTLSLQASRATAMTIGKGTGVAVYKQPNFRGECRAFTGYEFVDLSREGFYPLGSIAVGAPSDLTDCAFLILYDQPNFTGSTLILPR